MRMRSWMIEEGKQEVGTRSTFNASCRAYMQTVTAVTSEITLTSRLGVSEGYLQLVKYGNQGRGQGRKEERRIRGCK